MYGRTLREYVCVGVCHSGLEVTRLSSSIDSWGSSTGREAYFSIDRPCRLGINR